MVRLLNLVMYQVGWFACVLGAAYAHPWIGATIGTTLVGVHLWLTTARRLEIRTIVLAAVLGLTVDGFLLNAGVYRFPYGSIVDWLPPVWMTVLWLQFATTMHYSLSWLSGRYLLGASMGLIGAPLVFLGGERIGAVEFLDPRVLHVGMLGVAWSAAIPLLVYGSDRLAGGCERRPSYRVRSSSQEDAAGGRRP